VICYLGSDPKRFKMLDRLLLPGGAAHRSAIVFIVEKKKKKTIFEKVGFKVPRLPQRALVCL
jgi:hypothetical protein